MMRARGCRACNSMFMIGGDRQNEGHVSLRFNDHHRGVYVIERSGVDITDNVVEAQAGERGWSIEYHVDRKFPGAGERSGRHVCLCGSNEMQLVFNVGERVTVRRIGPPTGPTLQSVRA